MPDLQRLRELQSLPLERKVGFTAARIAEWYNHYDGKVHVSFSGGKDSTVLLYIVRNLFPDVRAMFVDTGLEYPEIRAFVKTWDNVDIVKPDMPFNKVIKEYGYPVISKEVAQAVHEFRSKPDGYRAAQFGMREWGVYCRGKMLQPWRFMVDAPFKISHKCCEAMKKRPAKKYSKETGTYAILAMMAEESFRRQTHWTEHGCNGFDLKRPISNPMAFWTEQDVLRYIRTMKIPICSVYGEIVEDKDGKLRTTGCDRTGCMFCMFGVQRDRTPNRFQRMYYTHPKQWDYCINRLGLKEVLDYIHVPYEPEPDLFPETFQIKKEKLNTP